MYHLSLVIEVRKIKQRKSVILGSLSCQGNETDIGLCKGDLDKSTCSDDVAQIDCTGRYLICVTKVASSHTVHGDVYSIQNCVTSLSETCDRSVLFSLDITCAFCEAIYSMGSCFNSLPIYVWTVFFFFIYWFCWVFLYIRITSSSFAHA
jgi:hypothetical protein